jgi:hypothetical protein
MIDYLMLVKCFATGPLAFTPDNATTVTCWRHFTQWQNQNCHLLHMTKQRLQLNLLGAVQTSEQRRLGSLFKLQLQQRCLNTISAFAAQQPMPAAKQHNNTCGEQQELCHVHALNPLLPAITCCFKNSSCFTAAGHLLCCLQAGHVTLRTGNDRYLTDVDRC